VREQKVVAVKKAVSAEKKKQEKLDKEARKA
jgi:hypothetical protein